MATTKTKKAKTKKATPAADNGPRYHMPNSPKSRVHKAYDMKGKKAAASLAEKLGVAGKLPRWEREWGPRASA